VAKPRGMVSPFRAAKLIGVHHNTVYAWCKKVEEGEKTRITIVHRDPSNGYLYLSLDEVLTLRADGYEKKPSQ
jgi:hypothetical protein